MSRDLEPLTVSQAVRRAVEVCEAGGPDDQLAELLHRYEDRDEPITAIEDIEQEMAEATTTIDPDGDPALTMAGAVVTYLAHRRDMIEAPAERILRLAADAEFDGKPPPEVAAWLEGAEV